MSLPAIPWTHETSDFGSVWIWETSSFLVTVNGDMRSFYWTLADKNEEPNKPPKPFSDGQAVSFEQAEQTIRETIGKAYPPALGYQMYAGPLAFTFTISTGEKVDFTRFIGRRVKVVVATRDGDDVTYEGKAHVEHYDVVLVNGSEAFYISPSFIVSIHMDGNAGAVSRQPLPLTHTGRIIQGKMSPGCTGKQGFLPGTVEHYGIVCPVHEQ